MKAIIKYLPYPVNDQDNPYGENTKPFAITHDIENGDDVTFDGIKFFTYTFARKDNKCPKPFKIIIETPINSTIVEDGKEHEIGFFNSNGFQIDKDLWDELSEVEKDIKVRCTNCNDFK